MPKKRKKNKKLKIKVNILPDQIVAGIDDATKCPCIGSIFVAGVVADGKTIKKWKKLGVKDSKLIAPKKRERLAAIIKKTAISYSIHELTPAMIDNKLLNLNAWEMLVAIKIINDLKVDAQITDIYLDNWEVTDTVFKNRLLHLADNAQAMLQEYHITFSKPELESLRLIPQHYADENHVIVGAASILAKTSSDEQYRNYKEQYGNFGSGSPGDPQTRLFVWQNRHNPPPIIRTSWNTYKVLAPLNTIEEDPLYHRVRNKRGKKKLTLESV